MDERDLLRNVTNLHAAGLTMLQMADAIQPYLDQAGIHREDWERAAHWLLGVSEQLGPLFSGEVILEELKERLEMLSELIMQGDKPDWKSILEEYNRE